MRIRLLSDLHLEFESFRYEHQGEDVVVLAGDIDVKGKALAWAKESLAQVPVLYVLGNHDFYGKAYPRLLDTLKAEAAGSNVSVLENDVVTIEGTNFFGCTLWTDFALHGDPRIYGAHCQSVMTDFKRIRFSNNFSKLRSVDVAGIHRTSRAWLDQALAARAGERNVVITHHAPSARSLPEAFFEDDASAAYASALDEMVERHAPALWLHGHEHASADYRIGACRVVTNARGYPDEPNAAFDPNLVVEI